MGALLDARLFLSIFDLLYRPDAEDVAIKIEGTRKRNGIEYLAANLQFHASRQVFDAYRNFYNPATSLVDRIDIHDGKDYTRVSTLDVLRYKDHEGIKFPGRFVVRSRAGKPQSAMNLENVVLNPELDVTRFDGP